MAPPPDTWFARMAVGGGTGLLFATNQPPNVWHELTRRSPPANADIAEFSDCSRGLTRIAGFSGGRLESVIFARRRHAAMGRGNVVVQIACAQ
jgi:assimilatory nitrate reductase catalytic subunit